MLNTPRVQPESPTYEEPIMDEDLQEAMDVAGVKREAQDALFQKVVAKRAKRECGPGANQGQTSA